MESRKRENREQRLTPQQRALTDELVRRANLLREDSEEGLSVTEAVHLASLQLARGREGTQW